MEHEWIRDKDRYWQCSICLTNSPTRRKPKKAGCPGPAYSDEELSKWRFNTKVVANGGTNLELWRHGKYHRLATHLPAYYGTLPYLVRQYVNWLNRQLDEFEQMQREVAAIKAEINEWLDEAITMIASTSGFEPPREHWPGSDRRHSNVTSDDLRDK
jgi:hypothetical protein